MILTIIMEIEITLAWLFIGQNNKPQKMVIIREKREGMTNLF